MKRIVFLLFGAFFIFTACGNDEGEYCAYDQSYPPADFKCPSLEGVKKGLIGQYLVEFHGKVVDVTSGPVEKRPALDAVSCCYTIEYTPQ